MKVTPISATARPRLRAQFERAIGTLEKQRKFELADLIWDVKPAPPGFAKMHSVEILKIDCYI